MDYNGNNARLTTDIGHNGVDVSLNYFTSHPDISTIPNSQVTVVFKSLSKKDSTTKEKSLEEFVKAFDDPLLVEDLKSEPVVNAWCQVYAKLAIDNTRNVRLLSHKVQAKYMSSMGKKYAKYLKTTLPIWLQGQFDNDKAVQTSSFQLLCESFDNDKDKVLKKIWYVFSNEIIHYVTVCIKYENSETLSDGRNTAEDDARAKYERVMNSSMRMLKKLIDLINESKPEDEIFKQEDLESILELIESDALWEMAGSTFTKKHFNSAVNNSFLGLLDSVFSQGVNGQNEFCRSISSARSLYKHVSKKFFKTVSLKPASSKLQDIVYGSIMPQLWRTLYQLTIFPSLEGKKVPKEVIWDISSKGQDRLLQYLQLGTWYSEPGYCAGVQELFRAIQKWNELKDKMAAPVVKVLLDQIGAMPSYDFKAGIIGCVGVWYTEPKPEDWFKSVEVVLQSITVFRGRATGKERYIQNIASFVKGPDSTLAEEVLIPFNQKVVDSVTEAGVVDAPVYVKALKEAGYSDVIENLLLLLIEKLEGTEEGSQIARIFDFLPIVQDSVPTPSAETTESLNELISGLGQYVEKESTKSVTAYFFRYCSWNMEGVDTGELIDDILTKYSMIDEDPSNFIQQVLVKFQLSYEDCQSSDLLLKHFEKLKLKSKTDDDWGLVFNLLDDKTFEDTVLQLKPEEDLGFLKNFNGNVKKVKFNDSVTGRVDALLLTSWKNYDIGKGFVNYVRECSGDLSNSLWTFIKTSDSDNFNLAILDDLSAAEFDSILDQVDIDLSSLPNINKDVVAVSNAIGANIHLVEDKETTEDSSSLIGVCKIFSGCSRDSPRFAAYCLVLSQYLSDCLFTMNQDDGNAEVLVSAQMGLMLKFKPNTSLEEILALMTGALDKTADVTINTLVQKLDTCKGAYSSYVARALKSILDNLSDAYTVAQFDSLSLNVNSLLKTPLKLSVVLSGVNSLLASKHFDRIRNYVVAEILGVKSEKILTDGLKWVVLSINFLEAAKSVDAVIPPNRLRMVLSQFEKWLESDMSYEESFSVVRSQLLKFLMYIDTDNAILTDKLVEDNLAFIPIQKSYEMTYFTLKYLSTKEPQYQEELIDLLFDDEVGKEFQSKNNMAVSMCLDVMERCFKKIDAKFVPEKYSLASLLIDTKFLPVKAICLKLLDQQLTTRKEELVVEYQLSKDKDEFAKTHLQIPELFFKQVDNGHNRSHTDSDHKTYLICWYIILHHFKDISFQIRNLYIAQVKKQADLPGFLDFIFMNEEIDKVKIVDPFDEFDIHDNHTMNLHLYYLACKYLGSEVQSWFNEIRDVQLKKDVNKFTTENISKILVGDMLKEVEDGKTKIVTDVMNIKINKVINEVRCVFEIDEQTMEMVVKIPANYPLGNVTVEGPKRIGLKENQWKAWLLSSQRVISLTNGSILEAIEVFKKNVDLHFSGFEECAICYSILHQDHSLPSKNCDTCNNKFHAACLYKWFKSSGSSTCPLCRQTFSFRQ